ncbi:MAG TPA: hypothetical protein VD788_04045, partial [Candidatus Polarisedimenticolaceae bacterium]|nr:hypothetical protein [Candidatus Polarisedimenticolaceae bacterium]
MNCRQFRLDLERHIAGEPSRDGLGPLAAHCAACEPCGRLLSLHTRLSDLGRALSRAAAAVDLDDTRSRLMERVIARVAAGQPARPAHGTLVLRLAVVALLALTLIASGALASWVALSGPDRGLPRLLSSISRDAAANRSLLDVEDSPYSYSNVIFRTLGDGRLELDFDVTRHVRVAEPVHSELVKDVLVHSLIGPSSTGARLKAISIAAEVMDTKVRDSLILAMHNDANLAVRLRALEILSAQAADERIEQAVLHTLREDGAVQMRLEALDYLATRPGRTGSIRRVIEQLDDANYAALMA